MARNNLPGPTLDEVPTDNPAPGITRVSLVDNTWSKYSAPRQLANNGMDVDFPTEGKRRGLNGPNNRT